MEVVSRGSNFSSRLWNQEELARVSIEVAAMDATTGVGTFPMFDPDENDNLTTGHQLKVTQDFTCLVDGFAHKLDRDRGPEPAQGHEWTLSVEDPNALLAHIRTPVGGWSRPEETDVERVLAYAAQFRPSLNTDWVLNVAPVTLLKKTYRTGDITADVLADTVGYTGKTLFVHDTASGSNIRHLHYHRLTVDGHTATISISDDPAVIDNVNVFGPIDPSRERNPNDLRNNVAFRDQAGRTTVVRDESSITSHDIDGRRHQAYEEVEAFSQSGLEAKANRFLQDHKADVDTHYCTIGPLDGTALGKFRAGDLISVKSTVMGLDPAVAVKRISHIRYHLAQDDSGRYSPDLWMADLEIGHPRRGVVFLGKPGGPAPFQPPGQTDNVDDFAAVATTTCGLSSIGWTTTINPGDLVPGDTYQLEFAYSNSSIGSYGQFIGFYSGNSCAASINTNLPYASSVNGTVGALAPYTEAGGATMTASGTWTVPANIGTFFATPHYFGIAGAHSPSTPVVPGETGSLRMTLISGPSFVATPPSDGPNVGQVIPSEQVGTGDGATTQFTTNYPYQPGSLMVSVGGVVVVPIETDPDDGVFTLPFAPPPGAAIVVWYTAADSGSTGADNSSATPGTPSIPPSFLDSIETVALDMTNRSGTARFKGDLVVVDTTANDSFTTSTGSNTLVPVGVLDENVAVGSNGRVIFYGLADSVAVGSNAVATRGSYLYHSSTPTRANFMGGAQVAGAFGYVTAQGSNTTPQALIFPTFQGGGGGGGITAHSGLTGLTSGDDHTQYLREDVLTTKGDIYAATASATVARLAVGSNGTGVIVDPAEPTSLRYTLAALHGELLMQDGVSGPPVPLETDPGQNDWLFGDM